MNSINDGQTASSLFLFLAHQKLLPSFPSPLDVTGALARFFPYFCITYFEFRARRISGTKTDYSQSTKRRQNFFENGTRDKRQVCDTFEEGIFPYNCLYTQAVAYTTYFELGDPAEEVGYSSKSIMVGRISESRTLFYRGHEINMASFQEEVCINIDHFYLLVFGFAI